jgi:hypothetical protein
MLGPRYTLTSNSKSCWTSGERIIRNRSEVLVYKIADISRMMIVLSSTLKWLGAGKKIRKTSRNQWNSLNQTALNVLA